MKLLRYRDIPEGKYSNAFLGYNDEDKGFALEVRSFERGGECCCLGWGSDVCARSR
jgi:hypothetical protein